MKIVLLASDIIDGLIMSKSILDSGKDVRAIVYEKTPRTLKAHLKRMLYRAKGIIKHVEYKDMKRDKKDMLVKETDNINSEATISILEDIKPDVIIITGTRKIKKDIFEYASLGAINMHSGMLPYYRGGDSEFWALQNGEKDKIGVTIHFIDEGLDSGDIILQARQNVTSRDNHKTLRMKNIILGSKKIVEALSLLESGKYERIKQDESQARTYKTAKKEDLKKYYK